MGITVEYRREQEWEWECTNTNGGNGKEKLISHSALIYEQQQDGCSD
jgi:hypothetical protein